MALIVIGAFCFYAGLTNLARDSQFDGTPQRVTGTIQSLSWNGTGRGGGCRVDFTYDADGVEHHGAGSVLPNTFFQLHTGDPVPIKYFLQSPGRAWIDMPAVQGEKQWWFEDAGALILGVVCAILGMYAIQLARPLSEKAWENAAVKMDMDR